MTESECSLFSPKQRKACAGSAQGPPDASPSAQGGPLRAAFVQSTILKKMDRFGPQGPTAALNRRRRTAPTPQYRKLQVGHAHGPVEDLHMPLAERASPHGPPIPAPAQRTIRPTLYGVRTNPSDLGVCDGHRCAEPKLLRADYRLRDVG